MSPSSTPDQDRNNKERNKQLMQIIIGSAWVDGQIEAREMEYLNQLLRHYGLSHDPVLQRSLTTPVMMQQTERWMRDYLFGTTEIERQRALAAIAKLMMIDDTVSDTEHQLLDDYYLLMAEVPMMPDFAPVVKNVGKFVKKAAEAIGQFVQDLDQPKDK
jgi:uncharacterized membrane protein YebE (DUF533 family)